MNVRRLLCLIVLFSLCAVTADHARATVVQVDGQIIPVGTALQDALNLYEGVAPPNANAIHAVLDAAELPEIFLPSTTSVVTFRDIAEGAGYENSFGYYNVGADPTNFNNLRPIMGCLTTAANHINEVPNYIINAEPGSTVTVDFATELSAGRYNGGYIAFYLITPEGNTFGNGCGDFRDNAGGTSYFGRAYFTERELNNDGDYVHHLVYRSRITANRFYFGYEDLFRGGDNDYEDMAMQVTGLVPPCIPTAEVCDGRDNDCDAATDEGTGGAACSCDGSGGLTCDAGNQLGPCRTGVTQCTAGALVCHRTVLPTAELCNGVDDNCNGPIDDAPAGVGVACDGTDADLCNEGVTACTSGALTCTDPNTVNNEACNGLDEDCDTRIDEAVPGLGVTCDGSDGDLCQEGVTACVSGAPVCTDATSTTVELCNGVDDNCDGSVDNSPTDVGVACATGVGACRRTGATVCTAGAPRCNAPVVTGVAEMCNAIDDDCDSRIDETFMIGTACTAPGVCGGGVLECATNTSTRCSSGPGGSMSMAGTETCNGLDDDCDGSTDEGLNDLGACGTNVGECAPGRLQCIGALPTCVGGVGPTPETCNALDDDCDGSSDERGATGLTDEGDSCGDDTGECVAGTEVCTAGALVCTGAVGPMPETCNALDDDCNAVIDDNPSGVGGTCGTTDVGACDLGGLICVAGALVCNGATEPQSEVCNGEDDDCDGTTDEDPIDIGRVCGSAMGTCTPGITICTAGAIVCDGGTAGTPEICNGIDDDCNMVIDDFPSDEGGVCGSGVGACEEGTLRCIAGALQCVGGMLPGTETCNGADDDCNGIIDEGDLCEGGECVDGMCSLPCEAGEFPCAPGFDCVAGFCLADPCYGVICAPDEDGSRNVCQDGTCVAVCDTVMCTDPQVCRATDGRCVNNTCIFIPALCVDGERCVAGACEDDPCDGVTCSAASFCRDGDCRGSCAAVECEATEICRGGTCQPTGCSTACGDGLACRGGACVPDTCRTTRCDGGEVCDPSTGDCIDDACRNITCPMGELCSLGDCYAPPSTPDAGMPTMDAGTRRDVLATGSPVCSAQVGAGRSSRWGWLLLLVAGLVIGVRRKRGLLAVGALALSVTALGSGCAVEPYCVSGCGDELLDGAVDGARIDGGDAGRDAMRPEACIPDSEELCNEFDDDCDGNVDEIFDLQTNRDHCGDCDTSCAVTGARVSCVAGECEFEGCFDGFSDLNDDPTDGCEYRCFRSNGGVEACDTLDNDCDGTIDETFLLDTDELNCGRCGQECRFFRVDSATCEGGTCRFDPMTDCTPGYIDRDGLQESGCEFECTPTGAEVCNGLDDDCDGTADEDFNLDTSITDCGRCGRTCAFPHATPSCTLGTCGFDPMTDCEPGFSDQNGVQLDGCEYPCVPTADPTEICDGLDNDCNGRVDGPTTDSGASCNEAPSGTATGVCTNTGTVSCIGGVLDCIGAPTPRSERCNGLDDDCDGVVDDTPIDVGRVCSPAVGVCSAGFSVCTSGTLGCVRSVNPSPELCNGLDDDCDGTVDDAPTDASLGTTCGISTGACETGTRACVGGGIVCSGGVGATLETCNGIDDDCDGVVDDTPVDAGGSCGSSVGRCIPGSLTCSSGALVCTGGVTMTAETCNNIDDNCNGTTDEGIPAMSCYTGPGGTSGVGRCRPGTATCSGGSTSACSGQILPGVETCNAIDDNCNGTVDEGLTQACYGGPAGTAGVGLCRAGTQMCTGGTFSGTCAGEVRPATEVCNGLDDNCNGTADESITRSCYSGTAGTSGVGTCRSGTETCTVGAFGSCIGEIIPAREWCGDGLNTDCDANATDASEGCLTAGAETRIDLSDGTGGTGNSGGAAGAAHSFDVELASAGSPLGRNLYSVWADLRNGNSDIYFSRSTDAGATWSTPLNLTSGIGDRCVEPVIVAARDGANDRVFIAYQRVNGGIRHLRLARSTDSGASFNTSGDLDTTGTTDNFKHQLAISSNGQRVMLVWEQLRTDNLTRRVLSRGSTDYGATFAAERLISVNVGATTANAGKPRVLVTTTGRFVFAWRERRAPRTTFDVFTTYSDDTTTALPTAREVRVDNDTGDNRASDDLRLVGDGNRVFLVYNDISTTVTGDSDVVFARSIDEGVTWPTANLRTIDDPTLEVSQSETPQIVIDPGTVGTGGDERVFIAWRDTRDGTQVFLSRSDNAGGTFSTPIRASNDVGGPVSNVVASPRMVYAGSNTLVIVYTYGPAAATALRAAISPDSGVSWNWTDPTLNAVTTNSDAPAIAMFSGASTPTLGAAVAFIDYRGTATMSGSPVQNGDVRVVRVGR